MSGDWRLWLVLLAGLVAGNSGCRTTAVDGSDDHASMMEKQEHSSDEPGVLDCSKRPVSHVCCEALTPACNDCRDREQAEHFAWRQQCLKLPAPPKSCAGGPPVIDCCTEASDDCKDCREESLNQLLVWKQTCSDQDSFACDSQPAVSACCDALIPSCGACRDRNQRITRGWQAHCDQTRSAPHEAILPSPPGAGKEL